MGPIPSLWWGDREGMLLAVPALQEGGCIKSRPTSCYVRNIKNKLPIAENSGDDVHNLLGFLISGLRALCETNVIWL